MAFPYITDVLSAILGAHWILPIPTFGVIVAAALLIATGVARVEVKRAERAGRLPFSTHSIVGDLALVSAVAGLIGARVFHIVDHSAQFLADPAAMIFSRAGFSIYGGIPIAPMLDATAPSMMLGYAVGRLGCQLSGDGDWGIASESLNPAFIQHRSTSRGRPWFCLPFCGHFGPTRNARGTCSRCICFSLGSSGS